MILVSVPQAFCPLTYLVTFYGVTYDVEIERARAIGDLTFPVTFAEENVYVVATFVVTGEAAIDHVTFWATFDCGQAIAAETFEEEAPFEQVSDAGATVHVTYDEVIAHEIFASAYVHEIFAGVICDRANDVLISGYLQTSVFPFLYPLAQSLP